MAEIKGPDGRTYVIGKVDANGNAAVQKIPAASLAVKQANAGIPGHERLSLKQAQDGGSNYLDAAAHAAPGINPATSHLEAAAHAAPGISPANHLDSAAHAAPGFIKPAR